jgi:hypothetical protein
MEAHLRGALSLLSFGAVERVESPPDRLPVHSELSGELSLVLAATDAPADLLDVGVGEFGCRRHMKRIPSVGHLVGHMSG